MRTTYINSFHVPGEDRYGPAVLETDANPEDYRGFRIYRRGEDCADIVKDGLCIGMYASVEDAKRSIDELAHSDCQSAPAGSAAQNTAEGLPSSDAATAGADTLSIHSSLDWKPLDDIARDGREVLLRRTDGSVHAAYYGRAKRAWGSASDRNFPWVILDHTNGLNTLRDSAVVEYVDLASLKHIPHERKAGQ